MKSGRNVGLDGNGMARTKQYLARCSCGAVKLTASGQPIVASVCYCDDCQAAARQIATLAGSSNVADSDGGTEYLLFRKDRFSCSEGSQHLRPVRLKDTSATRRMIASCCSRPCTWRSMTHGIGSPPTVRASSATYHRWKCAFARSRDGSGANLRNQ